MMESVIREEDQILQTNAIYEELGGFLRDSLSIPSATSPPENKRKRPRSVLDAPDASLFENSKVEHVGQGLARPTRGGRKPGLNRPRKIEVANQSKKIKGDLFEIQDDSIIKDAEQKIDVVAGRKKRGRPKRSRQVDSPRQPGHLQDAPRNRVQRRKQVDSARDASADRAIEAPQTANKKPVQASSASAFLSTDRQGNLSGNEEEKADGEEFVSAEENHIEAPQEAGQPQVDSIAPDSAHQDREIEGTAMDERSTRPPALDEKRLLGHKNDWKAIKEAIYGQVAEDATTKTVRQVIASTKDVMNVYKEIVEYQGETKSSSDLGSEVQPLLHELEDSVKEVRRSSDDVRTGETVADVYINAVPQLIMLLTRAMRCRVLRTSKRSYDLEGIEEIARIQRITLDLCQKVMSWEIEPASEAPVTKNIKSIVWPCLRRMARTFGSSLDDQTIRALKIQNSERARNQQLEETPPPLTQEDRQAEVEAEDRRIRQGIADVDHAIAKRKRLNEARRRQQSNRGWTMTVEPLTRASEGSWSVEEDEALLYQLLSNRQTRRLPATERYLKILNEPLLQNKLPEHIRDRAIHHKPGLVQSCQEDGLRVPQYVESIE